MDTASGHKRTKERKAVAIEIPVFPLMNLYEELEPLTSLTHIQACVHGFATDLTPQRRPVPVNALVTRWCKPRYLVLIRRVYGVAWALPCPADPPALSYMPSSSRQCRRRTRVVVGRWPSLVSLDESTPK